MSIDILKSKIKQKKYDGVYIFYGDEEYTKNFYIKKFKDAAARNLPEYNLVVIDGEKTTVSDISDAMNAPPYMSDFKAVIVNNLPLDQKNKDNLDDIANIACQLNEGTALIFNFRPFTIDIKGLSAKNSKLLYAQFFKSVSEIGLCVCFSPESGEKLNSWVAKHFESEKI
ncbi:MAG: hypothetical protein RR246_07135, partial [Clostridia bacterium]